MPTETTKVIGYFNPNTHSIALHSSKLGFNNFVVPGHDPGQTPHYIADQKGNKYNDPLLEAFVGPQMLAREITDTPVPVYYFPVRRNPAAPPPTGSTGFTSSRTVPASLRPADPVQHAAAVKAARGVPPAAKPSRLTATIMERPATSASPVVSANPVLGMSMADARRLGLVAGAVTPAPEGVEDNDSRDVAKTAPYVGFAHDGARRAMPVVAQPVASAPPPPKGSIGATLEEATQIDVEAEDPIAEQMRVMGTLESEAEVQRAPTAPIPVDVPAPRVQPVVVPPRKVPPLSSLNLPEPNLPPANSPAEPPPGGWPKAEPIHSKANPKETKRFVCIADGKAFDWRWQLKRHAEKNFPGREQEILAPYPMSPQALRFAKDTGMPAE